MMEENKKRVLYCFIAILLALLAFAVAQSAQDTADINNVFEIAVNNTDLGSMGTQERLNGVTYWANDSPKQIEIITHTVNTGTDIIFNFSINGTKVWEYSKRSAIADEHHSMLQIVPKGANYTFFNSTNIHHYEWREYPILSGKNGTLSVNQTFISSGGSNYNASYVTYTNSTSNITWGTSNFTMFSMDGNSSIQIPNNTLGGLRIKQVTSTGDNASILADGIVSISMSSNTVGNSTLTVSTDGTRFLVNNTIIGFVNKSSLNMGIYNINATNITASRYNMFSTQNVVTGSRAFGTVYQNPFNRTMTITVSGHNTVNGGTLSAITDSSNPPTTVVADSGINVADVASSVTFMVLGNNFYKVTRTGTGPTLDDWTEWV